MRMTFLKVTPEGDLDLTESKRLFDEASSVFGSEVEYQVILDTRNAHSIMTSRDLFYLAADLIEHCLTFRRSTAVISPLDKFGGAKFFENAARSRSFDVRAFVSYEDAVDWLTSSGGTG